MPQRLALEMARECESQLPNEWRWKGRRVLLVDGSTISLPDTPENQAEYPQSSSQAEGLGFPVMRVVALLSLATAMIHGLVIGPCSGKETGETALIRQLFGLLKPGDVVVEDRYFGGWFMIALLPELNVEVVTRLHQHRTADCRRGRRLGADDHLVDWPKPQRPEWLDQDTYDRLPATPTELLCCAAILGNHLAAHGGQLPQSACTDRTPTDRLCVTQSRQPPQSHRTPRDQTPSQSLRLADPTSHPRTRPTHGRLPVVTSDTTIGSAIRVRTEWPLSAFRFLFSHSEAAQIVELQSNGHRRHDNILSWQTRAIHAAGRW